MTYLDRKLLDALFSKGGAKRSDLEEFKGWKAALKAIARRNTIKRKVVDGEYSPKNQSEEAP